LDICCLSSLLLYWLLSSVAHVLIMNTIDIISDINKQLLVYDCKACVPLPLTVKSCFALNSNMISVPLSICVHAPLNKGFVTLAHIDSTTQSLFEVFHSVHYFHTCYYAPNYSNHMHNIYSLHTFTVFLLRVSTYHTPSSGRTHVPLTQNPLLLRSCCPWLIRVHQLRREIWKVQLWLYWIYSNSCNGLTHICCTAVLDVKNLWWKSSIYFSYA
jgi:hypothetical protein